jgi:DNA-binding GntR family transcriptional regulator
MRPIELEALAGLARSSHARRGAAVDYAAEVLRSAILSGAFDAGAVLRPDEIAKALGLPIEPVHDAGRILEAQGLITLSVQQDLVVGNVSIAGIEELFEVRVALETLALCRSVPLMPLQALDEAAACIDAMEQARTLGEYLGIHRRFHLMFYVPGCSSRLMAMIEREFDAAQRYLRMEKTEFNVLAEDQDEHRALLFACRARDADRAAEVLELHILKTVRTLGERLRSYRSP